MMTHVDEGRLLALVDGELSPEERLEVERHLAGCEACRSGLGELRSAGGVFSAAAGLLDGSAAVGRRYGVGWPVHRAARNPVWSALPRAAVLVLGFAAAASATLPGSPVRRWIEERLEPRAEAAAERPAPATAPAEVASADALPESGISVEPFEGAVRVELRNAPAELRIRALLVDEARAGVYASGAAASARFRTGPGRIEVEGAGRGELRIELPRAARSATVIVNRKEYLRKDGERLQLSVGDEDRAATEVNFRVGP